MQGTAERQFLAPEGCGVYQDRPAACRYYALGATTKRATGSARPEEFYFAVKEAHCLGHDELRTLAVREYRQEQGVASCDLDNFRVFVFSPFFHDVYDTEPAYFQKLLSDEVELMQFAARYLKQVLFGESAIPEKPTPSRSARNGAKRSSRSSASRCARRWKGISTCHPSDPSSWREKAEMRE